MQIDPSKSGLGTAGVTPSGSNGALSEATSSGMGKDEFLKLLTTQLQNQDPLSPLENHEFVAQLAQFSSLEQQVTTNEQLVQIQLSQMGLANAQLSSFVGKTIRARGDSLTVDAGKAQPVGIELATPASKVDVTIFDQAGNAVRTMSFNNVGDGVKSLPWDGKSNTGSTLADGRYTMEVTATDPQGEAVTVAPLTQGVVDEITFENGYPELVVGQGRILPADVISILNGEGPLATGSNTGSGPALPKQPPGSGSGGGAPSSLLTP